nr:hypothetical protein Iba_chr10eCG12750 [Ipomoea batatas]
MNSDLHHACDLVLPSLPEACTSFRKWRNDGRSLGKLEKEWIRSSLGYKGIVGGAEIDKPVPTCSPHKQRHGVEGGRQYRRTSVGHQAGRKVERSRVQSSGEGSNNKRIWRRSAVTSRPLRRVGQQQIRRYSWGMADEAFWLELCQVLRRQGGGGESCQLLLVVRLDMGHASGKRAKFEAFLQSLQDYLQIHSPLQMLDSSGKRNLDFSSRSWIIANMKQRPSTVDPATVWQAVVHADRDINIALHAGSLSLLNMQQRPLAGRSGGWMAIGGPCKPRQQHSLAASSSTLRLATE